MPNQRTRKRRAAKGLPTYEPAEEISAFWKTVIVDKARRFRRRVRWHADTIEHARLPSDDPVEQGHARMMQALGNFFRRPPKSINDLWDLAHTSMGHANLFLLACRDEDRTLRVRSAYLKKPGECDLCASWRRQFLDDTGHVVCHACRCE